MGLVLRCAAAASRVLCPGATNWGVRTRGCLLGSARFGMDRFYRNFAEIGGGSDRLNLSDFLEFFDINYQSPFLRSTAAPVKCSMSTARAILTLWNSS